MNWKNLLVMAVVAALFGFAGAELSLSRSQPVPVADSNPTLAETINTLLAQRKDLTPAQKSAIAAINSRYTVQHNKLMAHLYMARAELGGAFSENMTLSGPTKQAIGDMDGAVGDLQTQTINYVIDIRSVLTPVQRQAYDEKVVELLMREQP